MLGLPLMEQRRKFMHEQLFHYGEISNGGAIATGQPELEWLDTKEELQSRVEALGGTFVDPDQQPELPA